jgi:hypothetical protein
MITGPPTLTELHVTTWNTTYNVVRSGPPRPPASLATLARSTCAGSTTASGSADS